MTFLDILWRYGREEAFNVPERAKKAMLAALNRILSDAARIAQLERERDEARDRWLVEALYAIAEVSRGNPEGDPGDVALDEAYQAVCALQKNPSERPEADDEALRERIAKQIAYEGREKNDVSKDAEEFWQNIGQTSRYTATVQADAAIRVMRGDQ